MGTKKSSKTLFFFYVFCVRMSMDVNALSRLFIQKISWEYQNYSLFSPMEWELLNIFISFLLFRYIFVHILILLLIVTQSSYKISYRSILIFLTKIKYRLVKIWVGFLRHVFPYFCKSSQCKLIFNNHVSLLMWHWGVVLVSNDWLLMSSRGVILMIITCRISRSWYCLIYLELGINNLIFVFKSK